MSAGRRPSGVVDPADRSASVPERLRFDAIGSSNDIVLRLAGQGVAEHTTVIADEQTDARGGSGPWHAPPGGLWLSTLWFPDVDACSAARLTLAAGWGVREGIRRATGVAAGLKWPNDLVVEGEKLGGVVVEGRVDGHDVRKAAVGIGVNANNPIHELPEDVAREATSLHRLIGREVDLEDLAEAVSEGLREARALVHEPDELVSAFRSCWTQKGARVELDSGHMLLTGRAVDVDEDGCLVLETDEGTRLTVDDPSLAKFVRVVG